MCLCVTCRHIDRELTILITAPRHHPSISLYVSICLLFTRRASVLHQCYIFAWLILKTFGFRQFPGEHCTKKGARTYYFASLGKAGGGGVISSRQKQRDERSIVASTRICRCGEKFANDTAAGLQGDCSAWDGQEKHLCARRAEGCTRRMGRGSAL